MARMKLQERKLIRSEGHYPASKLKDEKQRLLEESQKPKAAVLTVEGLVKLYLTERIEDRKSANGKIIPGARKKKGQKEARRTLENDTVAKLKTRVAAEITHKYIVERSMV